VVNAPAEPDPLLQRIYQGDEQALGELFSRHRDRLCRIVQFRLDRRLVGRIDPDDVLQESYLNAASRVGHLREATFSSGFVWLRMIVGQTLIDLHRRHVGAQMRAAGREVSMRGGGGASSTSSSLAAQFAGSLTSPSHAAMRDETARRLEEALEQMDPIDREVLALRHFEELSNSEVAEVLGIAQKAASIRYVRALKRFKTFLAQFPGFDEHFPNA
jgi:RNA polymerase sigma-70 factor (ECF subfamily)